MNHTNASDGQVLSLTALLCDWTGRVDGSRKLKTWKLLLLYPVFKVIIGTEKEIFQIEAEPLLI